MEFQWSYFKSWKMMLWKCCTQYASKFGKLNSGHRTGKGQFSFQSQRKAMPKNAQTTAQLHSSHMLAKWCSNFSKSGFNNTWNHELPDVQAGFRKGRGNQRSNCLHPLDHRKSKSSRKTSTSALLTMPDWSDLAANPLIVWIITNCGKFFKRWDYHTTLPASWETCMQVKKE